MAGDFDLDSMTTEQLNQMLQSIMVILRRRDAIALQQRIVRESGLIPRPDQLKRVSAPREKTD